MAANPSSPHANTPPTGAVAGPAGGGDRISWPRTRAIEKGPTRCQRLEDVTDGTSSTVAFGEKKDSQGWAVGGWAGSEFDAWTSPTFTEAEPVALTVYTGSFHPGGAHFAFCDGSVRFLKSSTNKTVWYALLTRDGKEVVSSDSF
jgi:prepilin-type processing-associated H-X9-DG protein